MKKVGDTNPYRDRAADLMGLAPHLIANIKLYPTESGGKIHPAFPGWGCPCVIDPDHSGPFVGWDAWPLLNGEPLYPDEERQVGFFFLRPEGAEAVRKSGHFYLRERGIIGEAWVLS